MMKKISFKKKISLFLVAILLAQSLANLPCSFFNMPIVAFAAATSISWMGEASSKETYTGEVLDPAASFIKDTHYVVTSDDATAPTPTFEYYTDPACTTKTNTSDSGAQSEGGAPKNVGIYYIKATVTDGNGTTSTSTGYTFEIEKATPTISLNDGVVTSQVYNEGNNSITITASDFTVSGITGAPSVTVKYYSDEDCNTEILANEATRKGGTYYVKAVLAATANYDLVGKVVTFRITSGKPGSSVKVKDSISDKKTYDSHPFELTKEDLEITGTTSEPEFVYYKYVAGTNSHLGDLLPSAPKDVGKYVCVISIPEDKNFDSTGELKFIFTIEKTAATITWNSTKINRYYTGNPLKITKSFYTISGVENDSGFSQDSVTVDFKFYSDKECTNLLSEEPKDAGTYYIKAVLAASSNYGEAVTQEPIEYEIVPRTATAYWKQTEATKVYDGTSTYSSVIKDDMVEKSGNGTISFKFYSDEKCEGKEVSPVNVGTYYVVATVTATQNSTLAYTEEPLVYTITKAEQTITWEAGITNEMEYSNSAPEFELGTDYTITGVGGDSYSGNAKDVTFSFYSNSECTSRYSKAPTDVGTYFVKAQVATTDNYKKAETETALEFKITKASVTFKWSDDSSDFLAFYTGKPIDTKNLHLAVLKNSNDDIIKGDISYAFYKSDTAASPLPNLAAKGIYYVEATAKLNTDNYDVAQSTMTLGSPGYRKSLTIREELLGMLISNKTVEYTGNSVKTDQAKVLGEDGNIKDSLLGNLSLNYTYYEDEECTTLLNGYPTAVGIYYVKVSLPESDYYTVAPIIGKVEIIRANTRINVSEELTEVEIKNDADLLKKSDITITNAQGEKIPEANPSFVYHVFDNSKNDFKGRTATTPLSQGKYVVDASVPANKNYKEATKTFYLSVTNKKATIALKSTTTLTKVYDGQPILLTRDDFNITPSSLSDVTFKYYTNSSLTNELDKAPSDVGIYYIVATVAGDGVYAKNSTDKFKYTITKSPTTITLKEDTDTVKRHDGTKLSVSAKDFDIIGSNGYITIQYFKDDKATDEISAPSEIGNYFVKVSVAADENNEAASEIFEFKIIGTDSDISFKETVKSKTYDKKAIALTESDLDIVGSRGKVEFLYYKDSACTQKLDSAPKNAGTYYILAKVESDATYNEATTREPLVYTIKKAPSTISIESAQYECDDTKHTVKAAIVTGSSGKVTYNYYKDIDCKKRVSTTGCQGEGVFFVRAKVAADTNYEAATSNKATLINVRYDSQISIQSKTVTYNGKKQKVDKALVAGSEGTIRYYYYTDSACKNLISKSGVKDAGTYYVKAVVAAKGKYRKATSTAVIFVIEQKSQTCNIVASNQTVKLSVIKKKKKTFKVSAKATTEVEFSLSSSNSSYFSIDSKTRTITIKKGTPKGIYKLTVEAVAKENNNYKKASSKKTIKIVVK